MRCPVCGSDNRDGALFCRACGSPLDRKAEPVPVNVRAVGQDQSSSKAEGQAAPRRADVRQADVSAHVGRHRVSSPRADADVTEELSWETLEESEPDPAGAHAVSDERDERDFSDYEPKKPDARDTETSIPYRSYVAPALPRPKRQSSGRRYFTESPLRKSWLALTGNDNWPWLMMRLALVMLIPVFGPIVVTGYVYQEARSVLFGVEEPLPEQVISEHNARVGLRACIVGVVLFAALWFMLAPVRAIPAVGNVIFGVIVAVVLPFVISCCFRAVVCEKTGSGFNLQYAARLINRDFSQACGMVLLPALFGIAIFAAFLFIWLFCAIVLVGSSITSITFFRYTVAEQLASVSPVIYLVLAVFLVIMMWLAFTAVVAAKLVYTRAFAYFCTPLEAPLWPDFETAWVPTAALERNAEGFDAVQAAMDKEIERRAAERAEVLRRAPALSGLDEDFVPGRHSRRPAGTARHSRGRVRRQHHGKIISVGATARVALVDMNTGGPVAIGRFPFAVGKGPGASLQVGTPDDRDMIYACILEDGWGGYRIETMEYGGLTFVNGFDLDAHAKRPLENGDLLTFGNEEYRFEIL